MAVKNNGLFYFLTSFFYFNLYGGPYAGYIVTLKDISNYRQMINEINEQNNKLTEPKNLVGTASNAFFTNAGTANFGLINGSHYRDVLKPLVSEEVLRRFSDAIESAAGQKALYLIKNKWTWVSRARSVRLQSKLRP